MDANSQIVAKRAAVGQVRQSASKMSGDYRIQALIFAAQLEIQADILERQPQAPALPKLSNSSNTHHPAA
jgi:hypothetical protein